MWHIVLVLRRTGLGARTGLGSRFGVLGTASALPCRGDKGSWISPPAITGGVRLHWRRLPPQTPRRPRVLRQSPATCPDQFAAEQLGELILALQLLLALLILAAAADAADHLAADVAAAAEAAAEAPSRICLVADLLPSFLVLS